METLSIIDSPAGAEARHLYALIAYEDRYVQPLILSALASSLPQNSYSLIDDISQLPSPETPFLQIGAYEALPFEHIIAHPTTSVCNSYIIRKALIRKHYLSTTASNWISKHPSSILKTNIKPSCEFELDYAEFLDEALVEAWELKESWEKVGKKEWWILKPGMSDRGQGIRLFSSEEELQGIFEEWEEDAPDEDDEKDDDEEAQDREEGKGGDYMMTSHLRHFIAQPYIHPPLLLPGPAPRKFHIRTYVLASGALKVFVYKPMLALFAGVPYTAPSSSSSADLDAHLTNTCLQTDNGHDLPEQNVQLFWTLQGLDKEMKEKIWAQIKETTGEVFEAAAKGMMIHFQTLPNAFEVFGLDFLVDVQGTAWLLEVNAFPDFRQTGEELKGLVGGLWEGVVREVVVRFFGVKEEKQKGDGVKTEGGDMVLVRALDLGRR
jgi:tubulin--tyrosine ligase